MNESNNQWILLQITTTKEDTSQEKWIFGQYSCNASNEAGASSVVIDVKQASKFWRHKRLQSSDVMSIKLWRDVSKILTIGKVYKLFQSEVVNSFSFIFEYMHLKLAKIRAD